MPSIIFRSGEGPDSNPSGTAWDDYRFVSDPSGGTTPFLCAECRGHLESVSCDFPNKPGTGRSALQLNNRRRRFQFFLEDWLQSPGPISCAATEAALGHIAGLYFFFHPAP